MEELTLDRAIELAREAVAEKGPEYVYTNPCVGPADTAACLYVHDGPDGPVCGCLVGDIAARHGVSMVDLERFYGTVSCVAKSLFPRTDEADDFLSVLQSRQDQSVPWGKALDQALTEVGVTSDD